MNAPLFQDTVHFIRELFNTNNFIPIHEPKFIGNERNYLNACIDSTFVSYVGQFVNDFEDKVKEYTHSPYAIATASGTSALHTALLLAGVKPDEEVLTQPLTFIATTNAIHYCGAAPVFIDVSRLTWGMSAEVLADFLENETILKDDGCYNKRTHKRIAACLPVHIFGHAAEIEQIVDICNQYAIPVVEDAAESLGSQYRNQHLGTYGLAGIFSFNGNKIITTGGGGIILTRNQALAEKAKHITMTAKVPHRWAYFHDEIGFNYRLPNINAAVGCAQMEMLSRFVANKRKLAQEYATFFENTPFNYYQEREFCFSNYWLNTITLSNQKERDEFLAFTNDSGVMTRPCWTLLNKLEMYQNCQTTQLTNAEWLEARIACLPSSVRVDQL